MSMTHVFRNQATTQQKIQMISSLHITTKEEAIAFLRAIASINEQIAVILQKGSMADISAKNKTRTDTQKHTQKPTFPTPNKMPEEPKEAIPVDISDEEEHSESDAESRVEQLKAAVEKLEKKQEKKD